MLIRHFIKQYSTTKVLLAFIFSMAMLGSITESVCFISDVRAENIEYVYDELGRLTAIINETGDSARYHYDANGNILSIERHNAGEVVILGFTPTSGPIDTIVTIRGTGFSTTPSENSVAFNGTTAVVSASTATMLVTQVPVGATTGIVTVTTPFGSATSSDVFEVIASREPIINGFTPTLGDAGDTVTISGMNFETSPDFNKLKFNHTFAPITSVSATEIVANVPAGATSGPLSLSTPYGSTISSEPFIVPPGTHTSADIEVVENMAIGETKTINIESPGKIALILFEGTAGQKIFAKWSYSGSTLSTIAIYNPDGTKLAQESVYGLFMDRMTLTQTGTYNIVIDPYGTSTLSTTLTLYDVPPDVTGTIAMDGQPVTLATTVPGQNMQLTFEGVSEQRLSTKWTYSGSNLSTITIYNPDGTTLVNESVYGLYIDTITLSQTGTYTIVVDPYGSSLINITLTLYDVPPDVTGTIAMDGQPVTLATTVPGQNMQLTFEGVSEQRLSTKWTYSGSNLSTITIYNPDGTTLVNESVYDLYIDTITLSQTGTYTIVVDPYGSSLINITLTLYDVPPDVTGTIAMDGQPVTLATTVPGQNIQLTFEGVSEQRLYTKWTYSGSNLSTITIYNPDGTTLVNESVYDLYIDTITLPQTGTYTIVVDSYGRSLINITLTLYDVPPDVTSTITINGPPVSVTMVRGQNAELTFDGSSEQEVTVQVTNNTVGNTKVSLHKPDGTQLTSRTSNSSSFSLNTQTLPVDGIYKIVIDPQRGANGSLDISVTNP